MWLVGESNHHLIRYEMVDSGIAQLIKMVLIPSVLCYQEPKNTGGSEERSTNKVCRVYSLGQNKLPPDGNWP